MAIQEQGLHNMTMILMANSMFDTLSTNDSDEKVHAAADKVAELYVKVFNYLSGKYATAAE